MSARTKRAGSLFLLLMGTSVTACGSILGIHDIDPPADGAVGGAPVEDVKITAEGGANLDGTLGGDGRNAMDAAVGLDVWLDSSGDALTGIGCRLGSTQCFANKVQTCLASGTWAITATCPYACSGGACTGTCVPGNGRCLGSTSQTCDATSTWQTTQTCPFVCSGSGTCSGSCTPNSTQCNGNEAQTCDSTGMWQKTQSCPAVCSSGACAGSCTPGSAQCSANNVQTCNSSGTWTTTSTCPYACSGVACTGSCLPGATQCSGDVPQTCDGSGQWASVSACPFVCLGGACSGVCTPGALDCNGQQPQTCGSTGSWQNTGSACANQACVSGACVGLCSPGATQCSGSMQIETCGADGQWGGATQCSASTPACNPTTNTCGAPVTASPPLISPSSGTFINPLNPTITNTDTTAGGVSVCYTKDGSAPTCTGGTCGHGTQASLSAASTATISAINVTTGGSGYASAPSVVLSGGGATTQQTATSTLTLTAVTITNPGAGYQCAPRVGISDTLVTPSTAACATALISGGAVTSVAFSPGCLGALSYGYGDGYVSPTIVISPNCGETPSTIATASVTGSVDFITTTGTTQATYSTPPTVTITGSGTGAAAFAVTSNSYQPGNLQYNTASGSLDGTINALEATVCSTTEIAPAAVTGTYTFTLAEPDVTSVGGATGNLNGGGAVSAGQHICVTTASNFTSEVINITYGATTVTCGSGLPSTGATRVTTTGQACPNGSVDVVVPSTANFTVNAIACGNTDTAQNSSPVRSAAFEGISTAPPVLTTDQTVMAGLGGCQPGNTNCTPQSPWSNPFNVYLATATPGATVCYNVAGGAAPTCTAGGTCMTGTPYTAPINIATSGTQVQAVACSASNGQSTGTSTTFILNLPDQ